MKFTLTIIFFIAMLHVNAQVTNLEKMIVGSWYLNKITTSNGTGTKDQVDTVVFYANKTFRWIYERDSILSGTWDVNLPIKGIRLNQILPNEEIDLYKSYAEKDDDLALIDMPRITISNERFSFVSATEKYGDVTIEYRKKALK